MMAARQSNSAAPALETTDSSDALSRTEYPLHECVYKGKIKKIPNLLRQHDIDGKDKHGNTPLHLAVMLGHKEIVHLLLARNATVKIRNGHGWSPLAEAISYGDRQTVSSLLRKLKTQSREQMDRRRPALVAALHQIPDFYMEIKWDFQTWVPLLHRILPSDTCKIYKRGASIRLDTTLVDFADFKWERGDISFLFNGDSPPSQSLSVLDNKLRVYQTVRYEETELEIEEEIDILMSSDIVSAQMSTKSITFSRAQQGWFFRSDRKEPVGKYEAEFYDVHGVVLETRKRREHLSAEDLQKNKALLDTITRGSAHQLDAEEVRELPHRSSLDPPSTPPVSWEEYLAADPANPPRVGRAIISKVSCKRFKNATLAMSQEFPLTVSMLLDVLDVIAPFKHFSKLKQFVECKLPPGFPVKLDIPLIPAITAQITFQDFYFDDSHPSHLFAVPADYTEDPARFPDL
ncbi:Ankyrin repeat domain-containing protein 13C [Amphibalanus amphitrite]|uniref:Ankyrin repeat domain-containing protein 13C n=1 Tax=Amphibalanus amphitrite TaxID=1232801 RepID=A0A6A4VZI4_AMPAM|nr:ankyrin repeat domain-containing protein 13C-like [Amphibalanus amphitrite]XP_043246414.1 ankyrin repeat domain-containing protein 13C-like [Amphibalanus amphitrite]XP_043246415.1 ankyrin repeat domain-containing protein 13C-like [Amphibalanus amphitrite]XP_043246416.1 ankyrin repeat domain-containing protein 13C-like [Amphibalanus amphitrite]XP_043246417.1 ankyrin repeat domain-containing protein 13C-like [Amphibalanus amphitrite]XP_043246418.1 ankyrin repeat domain-containing protein 13C-